MRQLRDAQFGVCTFFGLSEEVGDKCGTNGLPLTPPSIRMIGRFQKLKALDHANLCKYLDIQRGKHDHVFIVAEHYSRNILSLFNLPFQDRLQHVPVLAFEILSALKYLHNSNLVHRSLSPENIFLTKKNQIRLSQYGLYFLTENENLVSFCVGDPFYFAPEVVASPKRYKNGPKVDVWAFGVIILELILGVRICDNQDQKNLKVLMSELLTVIKTSEGVECNAFHLFRDTLLKKKQSDKSRNEIPEIWINFISKCLTIFPETRPDVHDLLKSELFAGLVYKKEYFQTSLNDVFLNLHRTDDLTIESLRQTMEESPEDVVDNPIRLRPIEEVYFLWKLAGSGVEVFLKKKGMIKSRPPINSLPCRVGMTPDFQPVDRWFESLGVPVFVCTFSITVSECDMFGREKQRQHLTDLTVVPLSMANLLQRLKSVDPEQFYPCLELKYNEDALTFGDNSVAGASSASIDSLDVANLPKVVKEKDIEYQLLRMLLFDRLVDAYPFKKSLLWKEARIDIPPLYRGLVWATLLDVKGDIQAVYDCIDKETVTPTDRQIEVDIPRCHQYDELLSSPESHGKFKRVLKAWVVSHPQYVYWQGLDSLCAPLLYLNFNYESLVFACLSNFIPKYLYNFFLKDNSGIIQEYLAVFNHLVAFHDPALYFHLADIGFFPELYAIPWFLTMFAHVFPLHKLFHLWDTLLLGSNSFPLCVGVAILYQLRDRLIEFGFNECILLFSDMPEIDIEQCVTDSVKLFCCTPKSALYRQHMPPTVAKSRTKSSSFTNYCLETDTLLGMEPLTLVELKNEHCPRICADELIHISGLKESSQVIPYPGVKVLCVDIRPAEDFAKGMFPGSVNIPHNLSHSSGTFRLPNNLTSVDLLKSSKGKIIVVIGNKDNRANEFATGLVRLNFPKVMILHRGIEILRHTNCLSVAPIDL